MSERYTHLDSIKVDGIASTSQQGALIGASKVMPQPSADLDGVTIQYMGPTDSTYTFKRMYTCAMVGSEYKWIDATPVDIVQNSNGVFIAGTEIGVADSTKYGVMSPEQSEKVATSFEKLETVKEGAEPNKVDIIRVEGTPLQVSGVDKSVNITRDSLGLGDSAQLDVGTLEGQIPVLGANGQLPKSTIPPYATGTYVGSVRTKALLTSLTTAEIGDWAKVTSDDDFNNNGEYILNGTAPGVLTNWVQMVGPANVESVNGKSGRVVLDKEDIGLANVDNTSDAKKPISEATQSALNDCVKLSGSDSAQVIATGGLQIPNGDLSVGGGALIGKDTEPALLRVRGSIEATQSISGQLVQTENVASNDSSTKVASTAWVNSADSVVHRTGNENIDGVKNFLTYPKLTSKVYKNGDFTTNYHVIQGFTVYDNANEYCGGVTFDGSTGANSVKIARRVLNADGNAVDARLEARITPDYSVYALAPSWSVGTADNTDKILTTKMANSLPSLVHTTGNETIAGSKTFVNSPYFKSGWMVFLNAKTGADTGGISNSYSSDNGYGSTLLRARNVNSESADLVIVSKDDGTKYGLAPVTADSHPDNALVTKKWSLDKFVGKTGNETIDGQKTFNNMVSLKSTAPIQIINTSMPLPEGATYTARAFSVVDSNNKDVCRLVQEGTQTQNTISLVVYRGDSSSKLVVGVNETLGAYTLAPSWSVGTADNSDKVLTTKMANSLPSLVHTTGNETIAGNKTFGGTLKIDSTSAKKYVLGTEIEDRDAIPPKDYSYDVLRVEDKKTFYLAGLITYSKTDGKKGCGISVRHGTGFSVLEVVSDNESTYATSPVTTDTAPDNAIVTKKYLLDKISALEARIATLEAKP